MKINGLTYRKGQSLVELALLLPVLLLLTVVVFDLGRAVYYYSVIYNAAREGARYGIVHQLESNTVPNDIEGIENAVIDKAVGLNLSDLTISVASPITSNTLQVFVDYRFEPVTPLANNFLSDGHIDLRTSSTMLIER
jgi:Flp pilus assembly protein TadG